MSSSNTSPRRLFRGSFLRFGALILAGGLLAGSMVGCYGRFPVTNAVYKWNGEVTDNHVVNSVIMVVLAIIPVYEITILVDALVINSIEFWSGDEMTLTQTWEAPDGTVVTMAPGAHEGEAVLSLHRDGELLEERTYMRQADGNTRVLDEGGNLLATVRPDGKGGFTFTGATGEDLGALTAGDVMELASAK